MGIKLYKDTVTTTPSTIVDIESFGYVENVVRPPSGVSTSLTSFGYNDTTLLQSSHLVRPTVEMDVWLMGTSSERRAKLRALVGAVSSRIPRRLQFSDDGDLYYHVVSQGTPSVSDFIDSSVVHLIFESMYPWMWGVEHTYRFGDGVIDVGGTLDGFVSMDSQRVYPDSSSYQRWGFAWYDYAARADGASIEYVFTGLNPSNVHYVTLDPIRSIAKVNGYFKLPRSSTSSNTYPSARGGKFKASIIYRASDDTSTPTLKITERWM